jgi:Winged helix DNA-binding domain
MRSADDPRVTGGFVHATRLRAQLLTGAPARDAVAVAERLLATQAQDPRGARLAVRARTRGLTAADVDRELTDRRSLLITWLNRGTLHLVRSEDYAWLHALTTPPLRTANATRLRQEGVSEIQAQRGSEVIDRALGDAGPLTRVQLRERLESADIPVAGQALVHLLLRATLDGVCVRGPMVGRQHAYARVADWLREAPAPVDRPRALAELASRYLAGHAPASDRDLARWAGLPLRDARAGLEAIAGHLRQRPDGLLELTGTPRARAMPAPRLLGSFEPMLLGWTSREAVLGEHAPRVVTGGLFRGFAMVGGRAVAGWRLSGSGVVELDPYEEVSADDLEALRRDGDALVTFLGLRT